MIAVSLSSPCFADDGLTFPDIAPVGLSISVSGDTLILNVDNLTGSTVRGMFCSLLTEMPVESIACEVDGAAVTAPVIEIVFGSVTADRYTTRWIVGDFSGSVQLKAWPFSGTCSISGSQPNPFFGLTPAIASPVDLQWIE